MEPSLGPWSLPEEVFSWLGENVSPESIILELGSGAGTQKLCNMFALVYSIEHNPEYLYLSDSNYIYAPLAGSGNALWYDLGALVPQLPPHYDFLLIDGPPGSTRPNITAHFRLLKQDVPILYDDSERPADRCAVEIIAATLGRKPLHIDAPSRGAGKQFSVLLP